MNAKRLIFTAITLIPVVGAAHPGHESSALHIHLGTPTALNALDLRLLFGALILGLAYQAMRATKRD